VTLLETQVAAQFVPSLLCTHLPLSFISPARRRRLAVLEAGIAMAAALLPAIDPVDYVTALPSSKSPVGRTVLVPNVGRYTTGVWTVSVRVVDCECACGWSRSVQLCRCAQTSRYCFLSLKPHGPAQQGGIL
jgi:hypothetical protein